MQVKSFLPIQRAELPQAPDEPWLAELLSRLNDSLKHLHTVLSKRVSILDNLAAERIVLSVKEDSDYDVLLKDSVWPVGAFVNAPFLTGNAVRLTTFQVLEERKIRVRVKFDTPVPQSATIALVVFGS